MSYVQKTFSGYDFFEVTSALQKCVRRGLEEDAMYWALELEPRYPKYLWKRLAIMACEEISIANPQVITQIDVLQRQYFELLADKKNHHRFLVLASAILILCRSPKSRIADDFKNYCMRQPRNREVPDFALDMHTRRGKMKGRGVEYFFAEGNKVAPEVEGLNIYLEKRKKAIADGLEEVDFDASGELFKPEDTDGQQGTYKALDFWN